MHDCTLEKCVVETVILEGGVWATQTVDDSRNQEKQDETKTGRHYVDDIRALRETVS